MRVEALALTIAAAAALTWPALAASASSPARAQAALAASTSRDEQARRPDFRGEAASSDATRVADWVMASRDDQGLPFIIIDKPRAKVFVFDADGRLLGATLALLGRAKGDDTIPGIGSRRLHSIRPEERTTPAGRFVATLGRDFEHDVVWIDYEDAISLHRVVRGDPGDHRQQRLSTSTTLDKRISYGCVNVPATFYDGVVLPMISGGDAVVYILPDTKTIAQVFGISDVGMSGP